MRLQGKGLIYVQKEDEAKTKEKTRVGNTQSHVYNSLGQPRGGGYGRLVRRKKNVGSEEKEGRS